MTTDEAGRKYEHYVAAKLGLQLIDDAKWQREYGDTLCKTEIKFDRNLHVTGNIFVERSEKRDLYNKEWVESGPFKLCEKFLIGDCSRALLFEPSWLRDLVKRVEWHNGESNGMKLITNHDRTGTGIIIPYETAKSCCIEEYVWDAEPLACMTE